MMQNYALIIGHGRSGTNWLLDILDASPETFCRNEPNEIQGSPADRLAPIWQVTLPMEDMDKHWDAIAAWMGSHMGERDHRLKHAKKYLHPLSHMLGVTCVPARPKMRAAMRAISPYLRGGEWPMPWWVGSQTKLNHAFAVLKINQASRIATWVLQNRPHVPVVHIVRHPGGRLNSWNNRFLRHLDAEQIAQRNKHRLREVVALAPEWEPIFGDIEAMSISESELWFWRYVTETIHLGGEWADQYKLILFENLALDPLGTARQVYEFYGLSFTDSVAVKITQNLRKSPWGSIKGTPAMVARAWCDKLNDDEIAAVKKVLRGSLMETWWDSNSLFSQGRNQDFTECLR